MKNQCSSCAMRILYKKELERRTKERNMACEALGLAVEWFQQLDWHGSLRRSPYIKWRSLFHKLCRALDKCALVEATLEARPRRRSLSKRRRPARKGL